MGMWWWFFMVEHPFLPEFETFTIKEWDRIAPGKMGNAVRAIEVAKGNMCVLLKLLCQGTRCKCRVSPGIFLLIMEHLYGRSINQLYRNAYIWGVQSQHVEASVHHCTIMKPSSLPSWTIPLDSSVEPSSTTLAPLLYTPASSVVHHQVLPACWRVRASKNPFVCSEAGPSRRAFGVCRWVSHWRCWSKPEKTLAQQCAKWTSNPPSVYNHIYIYTYVYIYIYLFIYIIYIYTLYINTWLLIYIYTLYIYTLYIYIYTYLFIYIIYICVCVCLFFWKLGHQII